MRFAFFSLILAVGVLSVRPARAEEPIVTAMIALDALGRAASLDGADVAAALAATPAAARVTGRFTFGADRRAAKPMVVVKLVKGRPRFVAEL